MPLSYPLSCWSPFLFLGRGILDFPRLCVSLDAEILLWWSDSHPSCLFVFGLPRILDGDLERLLPRSLSSAPLLLVGALSLSLSLTLSGGSFLAEKPSELGGLF